MGLNFLKHLMVFLLLSLVFVSCADDYYDDNDEETDIDENPETSPNLIEGDIIPNMNRAAKTDNLWIDGVVPYKISEDYQSKWQNQILQVIDKFNKISCVKFIPVDLLNYTGEIETYIYFVDPIDGKRGCYSFVGKQIGLQIISLKVPTCFHWDGQIMHEMMHAIGFLHEQSRFDRDDYVQIHLENVRPEFHYDFQLLPASEAKIFSEYDYNSVMHYGEYHFSMNRSAGLKTITPLDPEAIIGQRLALSKKDCLKLNRLYRCDLRPGGLYYMYACNFLKPV